jgi:hypothetical protein
VVVLVVCFFFRKFCGDPALDESDDEEKVGSAKKNKKKSPTKNV